MIIPLALLLCFTFSCQKLDTSKELKPIVDTYVEVWNTGNLDALDGIADSQFELRMSPDFTATVGLDSLKHTISYWRKAYPDFHLALEEEIYAGDKAAARWTITATNTGPGHFPPTGKQVKVTGISIIHFVKGKIIDEWIAGNDLAWLQQLGFTLTPPKPPEEKEYPKAIH